MTLWRLVLKPNEGLDNIVVFKLAPEGDLVLDLMLQLANAKLVALALQT